MTTGLYPVRLIAADRAALDAVLAALPERTGSGLRVVRPPAAVSAETWDAVVEGVPGSAIGRALVTLGMNLTVKAAWVTPDGDLPVILTLPACDGPAPPPRCESDPSPTGTGNPTNRNP